MKLKIKKQKNQLTEEEEPTHVLNCAGQAGRPNVDWCEDNKEATKFEDEDEEDCLKPPIRTSSCK